MQTSHLLLAALACVAAATALNDWSYHDPNGPTAWATLLNATTGQPEYPACAGSYQSPVDLTPGAPATAARPLRILGRCHAFNFGIVESALKWTLVPTPGETCLVHGNGGKRYTLLQMHTHSPSEHTVGGRHHDAEMHFVHAAGDGSLLVVGVFIDAHGDEDDAWFDAAFKNATALAALPVPSCCVAVNVPKPRAVIPHDGPWFNYAGSLTTPPCSEVVEWWIAQRAVRVSKRQFALLRQLQTLSPFMDAAGDDNRPVQPLNGRHVSIYHSP